MLPDEHLPYARLTCIRFFCRVLNANAKKHHTPYQLTDKRECIFYYYFVGRKGMEIIMWNMIWPILIVVSANTVYNISAKSSPTNISLFASLSLTYLVAMISSVIMYFLTNEKKDILLELSKANWTTYALGIAIVGLELGFLCIYRAGWKISTANLVVSITLTCVLMGVGLLLYKEALSLRQIFGIIICAVGLILIVK